MSPKSLDVFALRDAVVDDYRRFATSFTTIHADDIRQQVDAIYSEGRFWPDPLIQINPRYRTGRPLEALVGDGTLDPGVSDIFRVDGKPVTLYKHQEWAIALAAAGESFVVTTGTGSGKSLCFFIPVVSAALRAKRASAERRTRAIVIYPMNALANSQLEELGKFMANVPGRPPVTVARYTGQESAEQRRAVAEEPPDILLTNFMMLELLMTRQDEIDRTVIGNCAGLQFLVLDELHTYRGRQGADVALLVRRIRERLAPERLQCIGTSATMVSAGSLEEKNLAVARVASRLFATTIPESNVVVEALERATDDRQTATTVIPQLAAAIDAGVATGLRDAELRAHPLAIWVETRLGITWDPLDQRWNRARPQTLEEAAQALAADAGRSVDDSRQALRDLLLQSTLSERDRTGVATASSRGFFAFKLHQFISGAGHAFATLEPPGARTVTVDGQQFLPGAPEKRLYPVHFCRDCGHEYHPVRRVLDGAVQRFLTRDIDDALPVAEDEGTADADEGEETGFLTLHATDSDFAFDDRPEDYPESWLEFDAAGMPRLKSHYRGARPGRVRVAPDGAIGTGTAAWFIPGRFRFCLRCGATHTSAARDRTRLASLSAEGRSSATTVLVSSALRWMHGPESGLTPFTRKLLGFTDNRQDAALQAGHFNDFIFVSLVRAGFLGALRRAGASGLGGAELGLAQQQALGFERGNADLKVEWLRDPDTVGFNLLQAEEALRKVLAYRVWFDQRRGWRYTNPNLEQLGLVTVEYLGLEELAADQRLFTGAPDVLRFATPAERAAVFAELFDYLRRGMAIRSSVLDAAGLEELRTRSFSFLRAPWGFGADERPRGARWLLLETPTRREMSLRDEELVLRGGSRSALGRVLKMTRGARSAQFPEGRPLWQDITAIRSLSARDIDALISALLQAARTHGLVSEEPTPFGDRPGYRLVDACVRFKVGETPSGAEGDHFFRDFYASLATTLTEPGHPVFGFEAREHTAQVESARREVREKRFRYASKEQEELRAAEGAVQDMGERSRFLPVLFCSPTMELGVDISALNAVYMRNVPPTPANYAQRSGRAGRSGQAALVLTYSSSQSPHDQYFFRDPRAMVHGEVRPPLLDLANRDLVESHLFAVWLACTGQPLEPCIADLLVLADEARPVRADVLRAMARPEVDAEASVRIRRVLDSLEDSLTPAAAPWYPGCDTFAEQVVRAALDRFGHAFDRWRDLFLSAEQQRDAARRAMDNHASSAVERRAAANRHAQAISQLELLRQGTSTLSSDFYTYRYLATEGFLPGYNFPRLPLMAFVPATADGRGRQTYLQRPRFLALAEFGPRSLVYHEGRAYRVVRAMLSLDRHATPTPDALLPTQRVRLCPRCGAGHWTDDVSLCHSCGATLGDAEIVNHVYRIENVATQPAERITANDEERQRQGFDLVTTFEWATRDHLLDVRRGAVVDAEGDVAQVVYGAGARVTRVNKGLRRRKERTQLGFLMDPQSGFWARNPDEDDVGDPTAAPRQWIVPAVHDQKNALLFQPTGPGLELAAMTTVQHALLRGIEAVFQLEEGEILGEPMPTRDARTGVLLYEATEGGAGVLTRLVSEPERWAEVALAALGIMHLDVRAGLPPSPTEFADASGAACVAACYRCVMSYYNQPEHEHLDRRNPNARRLLWRLARARLTGLEALPTQPELHVPADGPTGSSSLSDWLRFAGSQGLPSPDVQPLSAGDESLPLVWRQHYVAATLGEPSPSTSAGLDALGFELVVIDEDPVTWPATAAHLAALMGLVR